MPYYSDDDLDEMADAIYARVQQRLAGDAAYVAERERGRSGKLRRLVRGIIVDVTEFFLGKTVSRVVDLVLGWILG
ncbi:MAG TPA: hypothetical protein VFU49_13335 [Ktedonobacteraceae bacterium]|nr:hypothetical protein [Ktedonobacteraceae bacterium]